MWDERYSSEAYVYGTEPNAFLKENASRLPRGRVLSLGEGEGRNGVYLAGLGYSVTGVDSSAVGMTKAQGLAQKKGVTIGTIVADLGTFDPGESAWDAIISIFCHLPSALRKTVHHRVSSALKPGGVFLLESYTPRQLEFGTGGPSDTDLLVTLRDLEEELTGLRFLHAAEVDRDVTEGAFHTGTAAVVQVIAEKRR